MKNSESAVTSVPRSGLNIVDSPKKKITRCAVNASEIELRSSSKRHSYNTKNERLHTEGQEECLQSTILHLFFPMFSNEPTHQGLFQVCRRAGAGESHLNS